MGELPTGLERLIAYLDDGFKASEETSVRKGTEYVEAEEGLIRMLREAAEMLGGDVKDPQWYAGAASVLSVFATYAHQSVVGMITVGPFLEPITYTVSRLRHDVEDMEGVKIFDPDTH